MQTSNDVRERLNRYAVFLKEDPDNASLAAQAFDLALQAGELDQADDFIDHALGRWPDDPYFLNRRAQLHAANHNWLMAETVLTDLRRRYPDELGLAVSLASVFYHAGHYERCRDTLMPLLQMGMPADGYPLLLRALHHLHAMSEAAQIIQDAQATIDTLGDAAGAAALIYLDRGDMNLAARWSERALALDPSSAEALVAAGAIALGRRDVEGAQALLERALQVRPNEGRVWSSLGLASLLRLDLPEAIRQLRRAVELSPTHIGTWHILGWAHLATNELANAESVFLRALELDRNFGDSHGGLAVVLARQGRRQEAEAEAELGRRLDPKSLSSLYAQALLRGDVADQESFTKVADRLLRNADAPDGGNLADWVNRRGPLD